MEGIQKRSLEIQQLRERLASEQSACSSRIADLEMEIASMRLRQWQANEILRAVAQGLDMAYLQARIKRFFETPA